jgi:peptide deformylase
MLNPDVLREEGSWVMEEGCLSIPEIREEVERPETIRVRFKDLEFRDHEIEASGILGRVILHEIDHLNGVLFIDRLGAVKRKLLRGRLNKIRRGEFEVSYPVAPPFVAQGTQAVPES